MNMNISAQTMSINFVPMVAEDRKEGKSVLENPLAYSGRYTLHNQVYVLVFSVFYCTFLCIDL